MTAAVDYAKANESGNAANKSVLRSVNARVIEVGVK